MDTGIPASMAPAFERTGHPFHMWEGISGTPDALAASLTPAVAETMRQAAARLKDRQVLHLAGCGTSYFAGMAATYALHRLTPALAVAHEAFEFESYPPGGLKGSGFVAISHTGETGPVIRSIDLAREGSAVTVGVTDVAGSPLDRAVDLALGGGSGREPALPKTRSYVASVLRLYLLALELGRLSGQDVEPAREILSQSPALARQVLEQSRETAALVARENATTERVVVIGGGPQLATALEAALKLKEAALVHADGWELEESMHGPWVALRPGDLVILLGMRGPGLAGAQRVARAMQEIGVRTWSISDDPAGLPGARYSTTLPALPEIFAPLLAILPLYLFTYEMALARGGRPDCMRLYDNAYLRARLMMRPAPGASKEG